MKKPTVSDKEDNSFNQIGSVQLNELYASKPYCRSLFETSKNGIFILEAETGKIVDANPFLIDLLGYAKEMIVGKPIWETNAFEDVYINKVRFLELQEKKIVHDSNISLLTSDGRKIHVAFDSNAFLINNSKVFQCNIHNIAERLEAEAVLKQTRKELAEMKESADEFSEFTENVIDTIREPLLALDRDLRVIKASRSFYKFFKVTAEETIGKHIYELGNHQWDIPKLKELLEEIIPEKNPFDNYEVEHNFATIGKRVMLLNARQVKRAFGKEKVILLAIEDITERKGKEDSLKKANRATSDSLDSLLNHMHAPMIIWDTSMIIKRFNHQFELLSGFNSAEVIDKKIDMLFPAEKITSTLELLRNHSNDVMEVSEIDILTKDNQIKTVLWISSPILDEEGEKIIATISQDITSRKRTESALNFSETRYRRLFESAQDGILILDAETGMIKEVNPFLIQMLGYTENQFQDKAIWEIGFFKDIVANREKFSELQQKEYVRYDDLPLETADGRKISVEFISNSYLEDNKKVIQCNIRETTIRRQSELALQKSESHLRALVKTIPDLIWLKDMNGVYLSCNPMFERFFGAKEADIIGKTDYDFVEQELADFFCENDRKAMEAGKPSSNEEWVTFADDSHRAFLDTIKSPIYDAEGAVLGVLGIGRDITERKLAGQVLQASEQRFRAIFDQAPIAIALIDLNGHPIISNVRLSKMLGYTKDELADMNFAAFTHPEDIDNDLDQFAELIAGKISGYTMEKRYIHKDGNLVWANLYVTTLIDSNGLPQEIIGMVEDITEQKNSENKLKDSEEQFRTITENSADAIFITNDEGKYLYVNKQAIDLLGYSKEELLSYTLADISPKNRIEEYFQIFKQLFISGSSYSEIELIKKDGSYADTDLNAVLLPNGWIYGSCRDISKRKQLESELINAKERAEESDRLKTAFLHNISHEVRTPMNAIIGFSGFLNEPELDTQKRKEFTDIIIQSSNQLLAIIDDIISIASIEAGQEKIQENKVNVNIICKLIIEQYSQKANEKHILLHLKSMLADEQAMVISDATKLTQILSNLIGNALKFTQNGHINFGYRIKDHLLEFYVEDSGMGIPKDMQEKIFNRFRQVETTDKRKFGGSGLGLSISKAYVEMLGGKMWLTSELGKGSIFYFTIQYIKAEPQKLSYLQPAKDLRFVFNTSKTLLIAEDEDSNYRLLTEILSDTGMHIIRAENGLKAVAICKLNHAIDLVLMDIKMPEMDGFEATKRIKEFKPALPIIAQTAYVTEADRMESLACGCSDFISKPINKELLLSKIHEQLLHKN